MKIEEKNILAVLEKNSMRPMENKELILKFIRESLVEKKFITFFNWECPPRILSFGKNGLYLNFDLDLIKIFNGSRIDTFTELPRVVEQKQIEIGLLCLLSSLGLQYRFVKIIADTNAYYLSPQTLKEVGEQAVRNKLVEFKDLVLAQTRGYPVPVDVVFCTEAFSKVSELYKQAFIKSYMELRQGKSSLIKETISEQFIRTREHIGANDLDFTTDFSYRTIASYGAEGMALSVLSKTVEFSNCIWLNIEEVDDRTVQITNFIRIAAGKGKLPMLFLS